MVKNWWVYYPGMQLLVLPQNIKAAQAFTLHKTNKYTNATLRAYDLRKSLLEKGKDWLIKNEGDKAVAAQIGLMMDERGPEDRAAVELRPEPEIEDGVLKPHTHENEEDLISQLEKTDWSFMLRRMSMRRRLRVNKADFLTDVVLRSYARCMTAVEPEEVASLLDDNGLNKDWFVKMSDDKKTEVVRKCMAKVALPLTLNGSPGEIDQLEKTVKLLESG